VKIVSTDAISDGTGLFKVKIKLGKGMIGLYYISIDFATTTSYPFSF